MNAFSKEERVAFDELLAGFTDALVMSKAVTLYNTESTMMERSRDTIWRPMPYIAVTQQRVIGTPYTQQLSTQLSVPATLGFTPMHQFTMDARQLRDAQQEGRLYDAGKQKLASDINRAVMGVAAGQGSLVVRVTGPAGTYDNVALCDSMMNEQGVPDGDRYLALSSRDYNGMAGNLSTASRSFGNAKSENAYERSLVGQVASFETLKLDYANRLVATAAAVTIATNGAQVRFVPRATQNTVGGQINVDNRFQQVTVSTTTGVVAGAAFTIAGIEAVHHITKQSTGQLKTFRVISVDSGTTMTITPAIVGANSSPTAAELQYKNVEVVSTSATASITWLNTAAANVNPFWHKDSIELLPGRYAVTDAGVDVMRGTTDQGIEIVMTKRFNPLTFITEYTMDTMFGVVNTNPQMNGILIFGQT